jgi:hypothetical protein
MRSTDIALVSYRSNIDSLSRDRHHGFPERRQREEKQRRRCRIRLSTCHSDSDQGSQKRRGVSGLNASLMHGFPFHGRRECQTSTSECISVSCECVAAAVYPHRLAAFAWAVVGHAGSAPGRCRGFTAFEYSVRLRPCCTLVGSLVGRRRCCQSRYE